MSIIMNLTTNLDGTLVKIQRVGIRVLRYREVFREDSSQTNLRVSEIKTAKEMPMGHTGD